MQRRARVAVACAFAADGVRVPGEGAIEQGHGARMRHQPRDRIVLNTQSATEPVRSTPLTFATGGLRIFAGIIGARLRRERASPFFDAGGRPLREPEVVSRERRAELERDAP